MNDNTQLCARWVQPIQDMIEGHDRHGPFFVAFSEYRPELVRALADDLGFTFVDFRAEFMRPLGWEAARLPLTTLTEAVERHCTGPGVVLHNAEALLAAKSAAERRDWLRAFATRDWPAPVVVPIAIFQRDLPACGARFHRIDPDDLPSETILTRLATQ